MATAPAFSMSSESSMEGSAGQSIYAATKNAVNSFTRSWAKELGSQSIRVVAMAPGILEETSMRSPAYNEALAYTRNTSVDNLTPDYSKSIPLGRPGYLEEISDLAELSRFHISCSSCVFSLCTLPTFAYDNTLYSTLASGSNSGIC